VHESLFQFDNSIRETEPSIKDGELDRKIEALFTSWFNTNVILASTRANRPAGAHKPAGDNGSAGVNGSARVNGSAGENGSTNSRESSRGQVVEPRWVNDKSHDHMEKYQESMVESHGENVESHPHNEEP
ncbi:hypothetical protein Tco_1118920, partial [Tanacetum coccineum]